MTLWLLSEAGGLDNSDVAGRYAEHPFYSFREEIVKRSVPLRSSLPGVRT